MVKFFSAASASALESAINTFLDGKTLVSVEYAYLNGWYTAIVGYTETAAAASGD